MAKNVQATKLGRVGKRNALLAEPVIRTESASGQKDLNSELGHISSIGLGNVKRVNSKLAGTIKRGK